MLRKVVVIWCFISWSADASAQPPTRADVEFFESKVRPLLVQQCHECHSTKAKKQKGGLRLDSRAAILEGGDTGPAAVPGHPEKSLLISAIHQKNEKLQMPKNGRLRASEIALLEEWVRRGAPYPGSVEAPIAKEGIDWAKGRKFWSFQSPKSQALPKVRDQAWPRGRIDRFLLAEWEKRELTPSKAADPRVLIRRATFDLIGLPPTPEEIDAYLNDCASAKPQAAYEKLIDRLLASPQYGERWARFWLDLARYCDIAEPWAEGKGASWPYRDWVVKAFNDDLRYDQFVKLQLAADLMKVEPGERAALGFLGLSPNYWKELLLDKDVIKGVVAEEWEERIHTVTSTFLGLTVACARCHDHKFDPIAMTDYYALAGVFASIKQNDVPILADAEARVVQDAVQKVQGLQDQVKKAKSDKDSANRIAELNKQIDEIKRATPKYDSATVRGVIDSSLHVLPDGLHKTKLEWKPGVAQDVSLQIRGNPANAGAIVPRRFLTVFSSEPKPFKEGSGRLELARAMVNEGAPLSARVFVNRIWKQHFGAGLVETPSDFGAQGLPPSHPLLLDDLTARFLQNGWSLKWLHREIMRSSVYQQASAHDAKKHAVDPDNRWLWRMNRRRLDVEMWRDAMLSVAGRLDLKQDGPPTELNDAKNQRRTLYGTVKRRELHDMLRLFDFPDPTTHSATRLPTTTPLQQLFTLNSPFMQAQANALIGRLKSDASDDDARIRRAYDLLFGRAPTENQLRVGRAFLGNDEAWLQYAHVLLGSNEFLFVD